MNWLKHPLHFLHGVACVVHKPPCWVWHGVACVVHEPPCWVWHGVACVVHELPCWMWHGIACVVHELPCWMWHGVACVVHEPSCWVWHVVYFHPSAMGVLLGGLWWVYFLRGTLLGVAPGSLLPFLPFIRWVLWFTSWNEEEMYITISIRTYHKLATDTHDTLPTIWTYKNHNWMYFRLLPIQDYNLLLSTPSVNQSWFQFSSSKLPCSRSKLWY